MRLLSTFFAVAFLICAISVLGLGKSSQASGESLSVSSGSASGGLNRTVTLTIQAPSEAGVANYSLSGDSGNYLSSKSGSITSGSSTTVNFIPTAACDETIEVTFTDASSVQIGSKPSVHLTATNPTLSLSAETVTYDPYLTVTANISNPDANESVTVSPSCGIAPSTNGASQYTLTPSQAGTYTVTYGSQSKSLTVKKAPADLNVIPSEVTMYVADTNTVDYTTSSDSTNVTASSSNSSVATATVDTANKKIKINGVAKGVAIITVEQQASTNYEAASKTIKVTVNDSSTPMITLNPSSTSLDKSHSNQSVEIIVNNPVKSSDGNYYANVKVTGDKKNAYKGLYLSGYRLQKGVNVLLTVSGGVGKGTLVLAPKYNGTYVLTATNGTATGKGKVTVTGYHTLPQTGPDYTYVYVFGALLLVAIGGLVLVQVIKRRKDNAE